MTYNSHAKNHYFCPVFGLILTAYSIPFLFPGYEIDYFGTVINVKFNTAQLFSVAFVNTITGLIFRLSTPRVAVRIGDNWLFNGWIFITIASFITDITLNYTYFLESKESRLSGSLTKIPNLGIIDLNVMLAFSGIGLCLVFEKSKKEKIIGSVLLTITSFIGLLLGSRYYIVICVVFLFIHLTKRWGRPVKTIANIAFSIVICTGSDILNAIKNYIIFYSWVSEKGFWNFFQQQKTTILSGEIASVTANYFIGTTQKTPAPDIFSYFMSIIPGSQKFYDISDQINFYNSISQYLYMVNPGQGTAFSYHLESITTYGIPFLFVYIAKFFESMEWPSKTRILISTFLIYYALNIVRNGLLIGISTLKVVFTISAILIIAFHLKKRKRQNYQQQAKTI